jgi:5-methylcytosine-specific restriction endonuclease McrA
MYARSAPADTDPEDENFIARNLRLARHFRGHGKLDGDLTPECAAALQAVLDALGKRAGPEDLRSPGQRRHDALQEMCRRLIAAGGLPDRAGQPTQIQLHMTLQQLLGLDGAEETVAGWPAAGPGWDCDASISPIVTGTLDADLLNQLASQLLDNIRGGAQPGPGHNQPGTSQDSTPDSQPATRQDDVATGQDGTPDSQPATSQDGTDDSQEDIVTDPGGTWPDSTAPGNSGPDDTEPDDTAPTDSGSTDSGPDHSGPAGTRPDDSAPDDSDPSDPASGEAAVRDRDACRVGACHERARTAARQLIIDRATRLLCGPAGLAAYLRTQLLPQPAASISLPLDIGRPTEVVPPHLRRAIITRDRHCAFPGCDQPPAGCQVHHIVPRSQGGTTSLHNCYLLCTFHHLIAVHTWGWQLRPNPDGTLTASNPYRTYTSHSPPANAA